MGNLKERNHRSRTKLDSTARKRAAQRGLFTAMLLKVEESRQYWLNVQ